MSYELTNPKIGDICDLMRQVLAEQFTHQAEVATTIGKTGLEEVRRSTR